MNKTVCDSIEMCFGAVIFMMALTLFFMLAGSLMKMCDSSYVISGTYGYGAVVSYGRS